ncbi:hypothetical protein Pmani_027476 [Petrolisthes manimaculis]|uniref:C2H2-type domain-containing protein n=1 Tax=Petrolisthes manimaculis TaxID=1843537 RepID=A0AAE1P1B6_9EUCA|nr:hypothetical protein Pmani_027476 [Petrolisthes manimaculis]
MAENNTGTGHQRLTSGLHLHHPKGQRSADPHLHALYRRRVAAPNTDYPDRQKGDDTGPLTEKACHVEDSFKTSSLSQESDLVEVIPESYKALQADEAFAQVIFKNVNLSEHPNAPQELQISLDGQLLADPSAHRLPGQVPIEGLVGQENTPVDPQQEAIGTYETGPQSKYVCQWCGRSFDRVSNLKRHTLLHSGIKPFKCLYCNYRATQKANVVQHLASRHREEMRALLHNCINVNDILVPSGPMSKDKEEKYLH